MARRRPVAWDHELHVTREVERWIRRSPAFLLIVQEISRRHNRDFPQNLAEGQTFETLFPRDDLPHGALRLRTHRIRSLLRSQLSFAS